MRISLPADVPTRGIDGLVEREASREEIIAWGRTMEAKHERLKLVHDNLLTDQTYAPLLIAAGEITDDELIAMVHEAGWVIHLDDSFGTPEERAMWLNRFRRFRAAVIAAITT